MTEQGSSKPTKGAFKPPKWMLFGEQDGVPFRLAFRTKIAARKVMSKQGVSNCTLLPVH